MLKSTSGYVRQCGAVSAFRDVCKIELFEGRRFDLDSWRIEELIVTGVRGDRGWGVWNGGHWSFCRGIDIKDCSRVFEE